MIAIVGNPNADGKTLTGFMLIDWVASYVCLVITVLQWELISLIQKDCVVNSVINVIVVVCKMFCLMLLIYFASIKR